MKAAVAATAVFVDFDGTITDRDTFDVLVKRFAGDAAWLESERGLDAGTRSLRDVLTRQAAYVRGDMDEIAALLRREVRVDPTFPAFAHACAAHTIPLRIVSSGIAPIVYDRLREIGLGDLDVVANDVDARPDGWVIRFRDAVGNGTDKAAIVRGARAAGKHTVFIGDGRSDYDAAVAADVRFAKRGLALERYLARNEIAFEPFDAFAEVTTRCEALGIFRAPPAG